MDSSTLMRISAARSPAEMTDEDLIESIKQALLVGFLTPRRRIVWRMRCWVSAVWLRSELRSRIVSGRIEFTEAEK